MKRALALAVLLVGLPIVAVVEALAWLDDLALRMDANDPWAVCDD